MLNFYSGLDEATLAILITVIFVGLFVLVLWLFYRFFPRFRFGENSSADGTIYGGAIGTIFALIFAFVIVAVWQNFDRVSTAVEQEADVLNDLYVNMRGYPPAFRDTVQAKLKAYALQVANGEWKLVQADAQDPVADGLIREIAGLLTTFKPAPGEAPLHAQTLELLIQNRNLRHNRIKSGLSYLDKSMWVALGIAALLLLLFSCMLNISDRRSHYQMHACLGASMGLIFFLLLVYNFPFLGPGAIDAHAIRSLPEYYWISK